MSFLDGAAGWIVALLTEMALTLQLCLSEEDIQSPV